VRKIDDVVVVVLRRDISEVDAVDLTVHLPHLLHDLEERGAPLAHANLADSAETGIGKICFICVRTCTALMLIALMCGKNAIPRVGGRHQAGHYTGCFVGRNADAPTSAYCNDWTSVFWTSVFWTSVFWTSGLLSHDFGLPLIVMTGLLSSGLLDFFLTTSVFRLL